MASGWINLVGFKTSLLAKKYLCENIIDLKYIYNKRASFKVLVDVGQTLG